MDMGDIRVILKHGLDLRPQMVEEFPDRFFLIVYNMVCANHFTYTVDQMITLIFHAANRGWILMGNKQNFQC